MANRRRATTTRATAPAGRAGTERARREARSSGGWEFAGAVGSTGTPPPLGLPEIAFAGRSNVGKSSLINALTRTRSLARTSRTPGRTQQVNFFIGPSPVSYADLPGYGFARAPAAVRAAWRPMVERYVAGRGELRAIVVVVDSRRGIGEGDRVMMEFGHAHGLDVVVVASKVDKLKREERRRSLATMREEVANVFPFSAPKKEGIEEIRAHLESYAEGERG